LHPYFKTAKNKNRKKTREVQRMAVIRILMNKLTHFSAICKSTNITKVYGIPLLLLHHKIDRFNIRENMIMYGNLFHRKMAEHSSGLAEGDWTELERNWFSGMQKVCCIFKAAAFLSMKSALPTNLANGCR
jgi:hypothetical protein